MVLQLLNPLPMALAHYERAIKDLLGDCVEAAPVVGVERNTGASRAARLQGHLAALRTTSPDQPLLDLWPALGALEAPALGRRRRSSALVVHDPRPLRRQPGSGRVAHAMARMLPNGHRVVLVAHSRAAYRAVGGPTRRLVAHPILAPAQTPRVEDPVIRVLGQYKQARDLELLAGLGAVLAAHGVRTEIVGRGWPAVPGWTVRSGFLTEEEFTEAIRTASAVLVPYRWFWQSGVAVRALELGRPVIGVDGGFLTELQGDAPWLVSRQWTHELESWARAATLALDASSADVVARASTYRVRAQREWLELVRLLTEVSAP